MVMVNGFVAVGFLAIFFGFILIKNLERKTRKVRDVKVLGTSGELGSEKDCDVIIVGAGVAGAALAYALGKDGRRVHIIERDLTEPQRLAGEALLPAGLMKLFELGLEDCVNNIDAQRVLGYVFYKDGKITRVGSPVENFNFDAYGRSFHNGRFVQRLREKAASLPNVRMEEGTVTSLLSEKGTIKGVRYKTKEGEDRASFSPLTIVCDGCFSNLRRSICTSKADGPTSTQVGFILENCQPSFANHIYVFFGDPEPFAIYPISSTEMRCMVAFNGQKVPSVANGEMTNYLKTTVAPQVPPEVYDALIAAIEKGSFRIVPNRSALADPNPTPGALVIGDAFNVRHPIFGTGMTIALSDVVVIRDLLRGVHDLTDTHTLCKSLKPFFTLRKAGASTVNILSNAFYRMVSNSSPDRVAAMEVLKSFVDYLSLGPSFARGPMLLVCGLNPRPLSLFLQLSTISLYGAGKLLLPFPTPQKAWLAARMIWVACRVAVPVVRAEGVSQVFYPPTLLGLQTTK